MSSYYSQSFQYKLQGGQQSNYLTSNIISGNGSGGNSNSNNKKIVSNSKRSNSARTQNNGSSNNNGINDVTTYVSAKKMADYKESGKQSTTYIVQKPSGSTANAYTNDYGATNGSTYHTNKYEMQTPKINSHLLDHGYGATPQPSFNGNSNSDETSSTKGGYPKSSDAVITSYYKAVKRAAPALNMSPTPPKQVKHTPTKAPSTKKRYSEGTRYDTSLGLLTKKFVDLLQESPDGSVDLNIASARLNVQKRRIYDITNVLEGIGILEKKSKNNIQWKGGEIGGSFGELIADDDPSTSKQYERDVLEQKENHLDELIKSIRDEINTQFQNTSHAYITNNDLKSIDIFKDQTVIVVKAPPEAKLVLPDEKLPREIHFKADKGEIDVFLCPDDTSQPTCDPLLDDIRPYVTPIVEKYLSPRNGNGTPPAYPLRTAQRNLNKILFGAAVSNDPSDDFGPLENRAKTITPPKSLIEIDNLIDKILDVESSSASVYNSSATVTTTAEKKPSTTDCYRQPQQYESTANCSQRQTDIRQSQAHSAERSDGDSDSTAKLYGQDDASLLQINNNVATSASVAVATTSTAKQTKGVRNALMSEMVDFSSLNSMISTQQDNATDLDAFTRFLAIEPPLDTDYNFALNNSEGLCDLFDFDL